MKSVTQRIKEIKQPTGGYINPREFKIIELEDQIELNNEENINPGLVGLAVDYMTRFMSNGNIEEAFKISLMGAQKINEIKKVQKLLDNNNAEITRFVRFEKGEGLQKREENFAEEVAKQMNQ